MKNLKTLLLLFFAITFGSSITFSIEEIKLNISEAQKKLVEAQDGLNTLALTQAKKTELNPESSQPLNIFYESVTQLAFDTMNQEKFIKIDILKFNNLKVLILPPYEGKINDIYKLSSLKQLSCLDISGHLIDTIAKFTEISKIISLEVLIMNRCEVPSKVVKEFDRLKKLVNLKSIHIKETNNVLPHVKTLSESLGGKLEIVT